MQLFPSTYVLQLFGPFDADWQGEIDKMIKVKQTQAKVASGDTESQIFTAISRLLLSEMS